MKITTTVEFDMEELMSQIQDLRDSLAQLGTDLSEQNVALSEAMARVEAKILELGEPDADLTADIQAVRDASAGIDAATASLQGLVAAPIEEPPVDPSV